MHDAREREREKKINADDDGGDDVGDEKPRSSSSLGRSAIVHALRSQQSLISNSIGEKGVIEILGGEETRRGEARRGEARRASVGQSVGVPRIAVLCKHIDPRIERVRFDTIHRTSKKKQQQQQNPKEKKCSHWPLKLLALDLPSPAFDSAGHFSLRLEKTRERQ